MASHPAAMLALVPAALVAFFALATAAVTVPQFFDPCHEWSSGSGEQHGSLELTEECPSRSGSSRTRAEAVLNLVAVQGVLLVAAAAIARGAIRLDRAWTGAGGSMVAAMAPPLGLGILWVPILVMAILVFVAARWLPVSDTSLRERTAAFAVAIVGVSVLVVFLAADGNMTLALLAAVFGAAGILGTASMARRTSPADES